MTAYWVNLIKKVSNERYFFAFGRRHHLFHMQGNVLRHRGSPVASQCGRAAVAVKSGGPIIPGRVRKHASPEAITTGGNGTENAGVMDSGLAQERAPE